jgi:plastocyanin
MALVRATVVPLAALLLAGCGGGEPAAEVRDGRVSIALDDFYLTPQRLEAEAGRATFEVVNRGRLPHNFRLVRGAREPLQVTTMLPGESGDATIELARGRYRMVCTVANHAQLGMTGTLVVR